MVIHSINRRDVTNSSRKRGKRYYGKKKTYRTQKLGRQRGGSSRDKAIENSKRYCRFDYDATKDTETNEPHGWYIDLAPHIFNGNRYNTQSTLNSYLRQSTTTGGGGGGWNILPPAAGGDIFQPHHHHEHQCLKKIE